MFNAMIKLDVFVCVKVFRAGEESALLYFCHFPILFLIVSKFTLVNMLIR